MVYDLAIVGSGMGGSLLALAARKLGLSVVLIERGKHPRFAIGESTSPLMNLLLEELAHNYDLPQLLPLTQWGSWKQHYPNLGVGKKRGFSYYAEKAGQPFGYCPDRTDQLLVAASPADPCADTHWLRADVDHWLKDEAVALGADYLEQASVSSATVQDGIWLLTLTSQPEPITARFLVDASGPHGFLHRRNGWDDVGFSGYPETCALYSHFTGVKHFAEMPPPPPSLSGSAGTGEPENDSDETLPGTSVPPQADKTGAGGASVPYPPDWAALHHVFEGGWMWVLRYDDERVSAGISVEKWLSDELQLKDKEAGWKRFLQRFPSIGDQFADAVAIEPWVYAEKLAFRTERAAGVENGAPWALLPSAAGFIDPFYSTGMTLTLIGVGRLARALEAGVPDDEALRTYEALTFEDLDWTAEFVACHFAYFRDFERFAALTMYYFAAASYSEMARRLGVPAPRFLAGDDPLFRAGIARCRRDKTDSHQRFATRIAADIAHKNVAGLADGTKKNWYGVDLEDVVRGAEKLGFTPEQMQQLLAEAAWARCE
ncbi:MAG: tryptophan 7-halogenase [Armatimonas sp.]